MKELLIKPDSKVRLKDFDTDPVEATEKDKDSIKLKTLELGKRLSQLQELLFAERKQRVLIVLQGLDTSGKDSTIRRVFAAVSPAGLRVASFKAPTLPELEHDYLWRVHKDVPGNGELVVFNRSHYEEVLVVRVQKLKDEATWSRRYGHIREFERLLADEGTLILKFFLHISQDEQKRRLTARLEDSSKHWKLDTSDFRDRAYWGKYWEAYEEAIEKTSTPWAPWYVIPANRKWWRDHLITGILVEELEKLKMKFPKPPKGIEDLKL